MKEGIKAKLSERKTVHQWLNDLKIPKTESGRKLCLLRRLRITLDRYQRYETCLEVVAKSAAKAIKRHRID